MDKKKNVIVIGAGIAGIAAANKLSKKYEVIILEAHSDVGGRAKNINGIPIGPMHVHESGEYSGDGGIPRYIEAHSDLDLSSADLPNIQPIPDLLEKFNIPIYLNTSDRIIIVGEKSETFNVEKFNSYLQDYSLERNIILSNMSLEETLALKLNNLFEEAFSGLNIQELKTIMKNAAERNMDFFKYGDAHPLVGGNGYHGLIKSMVNNMKNVKIQLNTTVKSIEINNDKVLVTTSNDEQFVSDAVIPTIPLGVLQKNIIEIKDISDVKRKSFQKFKMGMMNKVILKYENQFWDNTPTFYRIINTSPNKNPITLVMNCNHIFSDADPTLMLGIFAVQALIDKEIQINNSLDAIQAAWPNAPDPISCEVTAWHLDPHCYGSYASFSEKTHLVDYANIMQPEWDGKLVLAGDGIVPPGLQGCFHGAYISGLRAARLIDKYQEVCNV